MDKLSKNDELVLLTILRLESNAYGVTIRREIQKTIKKLYGYGTLYSALSQLTQRGFITKITGSPKPEKGGRRKYFYSITKQGAEALKNARKVHALLWRDITDIRLDMIK